MQLSTRERDYIVDPLKLRTEMDRLLPIFTDPGIVKVCRMGLWSMTTSEKKESVFVAHGMEVGHSWSFFRCDWFDRVRKWAWNHFLRAR